MMPYANTADVEVDGGMELLPDQDSVEVDGGMELSPDQDSVIFSVLRYIYACCFTYHDTISLKELTDILRRSFTHRVVRFCHLQDESGRVFIFTNDTLNPIQDPALYLINRLEGMYDGWRGLLECCKQQLSIAVFIQLLLILQNNYLKNNTEQPNTAPRWIDTTTPSTDLDKASRCRWPSRENLSLPAAGPQIC